MYAKWSQQIIGKVKKTAQFRKDSSKILIFKEITQVACSSLGLIIWINIAMKWLNSYDSGIFNA